MRGNLKVVQGKIIARKRKQAIYKGIFTLFFVLVAFFSIAWLSQLSAFAITTVRVEGTREISIASIEAIVRESIAGNYSYLFSKSNIFLYPKQIVLDQIGAVSLVQGVTLRAEGLHTIVVIIDERSEAMRWCEDEVDAACFSADQNGFIYAPSELADTEYATSSVIYRGDLGEATVSGSTGTGPIGKHIMPPEDFKPVQFFLRELGADGVMVREVVIGETSYITVILSGGGRLIVNSVDDLSAVLSNLESVLSNKTIAPSTSAFLDSLDYMRLDSGNKIFYKVKGKAQLVTTATTTL